MRACPSAWRIMAAMVRGLVMVVALAAATRAHADGVFEVCKGESKTVVSGRGRMSIAVVYPDTFPATTTPAMRLTPFPGSTTEWAVVALLIAV